MPLSPNEPFEPGKSIWTEADFDQMGWHDVSIHGLAFSAETSELLLDIDYLFAWVDPEEPSPYYTFWMAPCTLVFENVHSFTADIGWGLGLEISDVSREDGGRPDNARYIGKDLQWKWVFECQEGTFSFLSTGYVQITRGTPEQSKKQSFSWDERGGVSFARKAYDGVDG